MSAGTTQIKGFDDPVFDSQQVFRVVLDALSQPGRVWNMPFTHDSKTGLASATAEIFLCILDQSTTLWLDPSFDTEVIAAFLRFHTGCAVTRDPQAASFAVLAHPNQPEALASFNLGTPEYPDRSTTLIVQVDGLIEGAGVRLRGPGIEAERRLEILGAGPAFWAAVQTNNALYPLGVDFVLVSNDQVAGLPRSTVVEV